MVWGTPNRRQKFVGMHLGIYSIQWFLHFLLAIHGPRDVGFIRSYSMPGFSNVFSLLFCCAFWVGILIAPTPPTPPKLKTLNPEALNLKTLNPLQLRQAWRPWPA